MTILFSEFLPISLASTALWLAFSCFPKTRSRLINGIGAFLAIASVTTFYTVTKSGDFSVLTCIAAMITGFSVCQIIQRRIGGFYEPV
jgi:hypothetical protein